MEEKEKLAYTAGIIDGEGCISIDFHKDRRRRGASFSVRVRVASVTPSLILWLRENYGGHVYTREFKNKNQKPAYEWCLAGIKNVYELLRSVYPYLMIKKLQCEAFFDYAKISKAYNKWSPVTDGEYKRRIELHLLIKKLNYRGVPAAETERMGLDKTSMLQSELHRIKDAEESRNWLPLEF